MAIDITQDLVDGSDGALGDAIPHVGGVSHVNGGQNGDAQHIEGDAVNLNQIEKPTKESDNLRDALSSAFLKTEEQTAEEAERTPATPYEGPKLSKDSNGKWHTPDGSFATKEQIEAFEKAQGAEVQQPATETPLEGLYAGMTPMEQEQFKALPEELRSYVGRTMEALNGQATKFAEYTQIESVINARRGPWMKNGLTPAAAIGQVLALSDYASNSPDEFILWFAEQNNIDLDALLDAEEVNQTTDPVVRELQGQLAQLQQTLAQQQGGQQSAAYNSNLQEVQTFAQEKDGAGNLLRPYLGEVTSTWASFVQAVRAANPTMPNAQVLQQAYESACFANPTVRSKIQKDMDDARRRAAAAAAAAKKASNGSIAGGPAGAGVTSRTNNDNLSIRDELKAAFAEHV